MPNLGHSHCYWYLLVSLNHMHSIWEQQLNVVFQNKVYIPIEHWIDAVYSQQIPRECQTCIVTESTVVQVSGIYSYIYHCWEQ